MTAYQYYLGGSMTQDLVSHPLFVVRLALVPSRAVRGEVDRLEHSVAAESGLHDKDVLAAAHQVHVRRQHTVHVERGAIRTDSCSRFIFLNFLQN